MAGLRLKLLGGLELRPASGAPIPLPARKPALLLAYLALRPGRPQGRDKLAALFWGDSGEAQARASLRQALAFLRRRLGPHEGLILTPEGETVALAPDGLATDVAELERCLASGTRGALERAVALYEGDFLDGFQTRQPLVEEWLLVERQRLRERALAAMMALLPETAAADPPEAGVRLAPAHPRPRPAAGSGAPGADAPLRPAGPARRRAGPVPDATGDARARARGDARGGDTAPPQGAPGPARRRARRPRRWPGARRRSRAPPSRCRSGGEAPAASRGAGGDRPAVPPPPERRRLTILVCDLCGAAALASRLDPEETHDLLGRYRWAVDGEIARLEGHVARLTGGEVFAWFGWPRAHEDAAERAVRAGLAAVAAVARLKGPDGRAAGGPGRRRDRPRRGGRSRRGWVRRRDGGRRADPGPGHRPAAPGPTRDGAALGGDPRPRRRPVRARGARSAAARGRAGPAPAWRARGRTPGREPVRGARRGPAAAPMVGRDEELALLLRRWRLAAAGEGQAVLLVGEPGIGKSRGRGALVDPGRRGPPRCPLPVLAPTPAQRALAGGAAARARRRADGRGGRRDRHQARQARGRSWPSVPAGAGRRPCRSWRSCSGSPRATADPAPELTPQQRRARTLEPSPAAAGAGRRRPVLMVLEDAHWLDPTTLELLGLRARPDRAPRGC